MRKKHEAPPAEKRDETAAARADRPTQVTIAPENDAKKTKQAAQKNKAKAEKRRKKRRGSGLVFASVLLFLLAIAGVMTIFNLFGVRDKMIHGLSLLDDEYVSIANRQNAIKQAELDAKEKEKKLETLEERLNQRAESLDGREQEIENGVIVPDVVSTVETSEEKLAELKQLGLVYNAMDAEKAAGILQELYEVSDIATIVSFMKKDRAAAVLSEFEAAFAAQITQYILDK